MKRRIILYSVSILAVIAIFALTALFTRPGIPSTSEEKIALYTRNKPHVQLTVAVVTTDGQEVHTYGHDGKEIDVTDEQYAIGTITRSFTGALAAKAISEGKISLTSKVGDYITLAPGTYEPTIYELLTHTSGYGDYRLYGSAETAVIKAIEDFRLNTQPPFGYSESDIGVAVMGIVLSSVYEKPFDELMFDFISQELGMENTSIMVGYNNAYAASTGLSSNVTDMISYVRHYLSHDNDYLRRATVPLAEINKETSIGYLWKVSDTGILATDGGGSESAGKLLIDRPHGTAIIVLSNYGNDKYGDVTDIATALLAESVN